MKLLSILVLSLTFAFAAYADGDSEKWVKLLGQKKIVCQPADHSKQEDFPIIFSVEKNKIKVDGQKADQNNSIYDDDYPEVEVSKNWIIFTLVSDATIYKEFHIRYEAENDKLEIFYGVFDHEADGDVKAFALDCDLK